MIEDVIPSISKIASAIGFTSLANGNDIDIVGGAIARGKPSRTAMLPMSSSSINREGVVVVDAMEHLEDISSDDSWDKTSLPPPSSPNPSPLFLLIEKVELASKDGSKQRWLFSNRPALDRWLPLLSLQSSPSP